MGKNRWALALTLALLVPAMALAAPYLGDASIFFDADGEWIGSGYYSASPIEVDEDGAWSNQDKLTQATIVGKRKVPVYPDPTGDARAIGYVYRDDTVYLYQWYFDQEEEAYWCRVFYEDWTRLGWVHSDWLDW